MIDSAVRILVVRHGQSTWNAEQRWQGQADPPLSLLGERQAVAAAGALAASTLAAVVSSDLQRARRTAELLVPESGVVADPAWRERHAGAWTGLTRTEIETEAPGAIDRGEWPPGFEGDQEVLRRVLPALDRMASGLSAGSAALVVTHGGVIRTLEAHLGATARAIPNLGGRWLEVDGRGPRSSRASAGRPPGEHASATEIRLGEPELLIGPDDDVVVTVPVQI